MRRSGGEAGAKRRRSAATLVAFALLVLLAAPRGAHAGEPRAVAVRISESLHDGCPKDQGMRERLEAELGRVREAGPGDAAIDLEFRVEQQGALSKGTLRVVAFGVSVERTASSRSCADVITALAMMAAIAIEEESARSADVPEGAREGTSRAAPPTRAVPEKPIATAVRPKAVDRAKAIALAFGTAFEVNGNRGSGVLAATWFGQVGLSALPLEPIVRVGLSRSTQERISSRRGVLGVRWSELTLVACADVVRERTLRVGPCLNGEIGVLEASVDAPPPARSFSYLWLTLGGAARLSWWPLPRLAVEAMAGVRVPLNRSELFFEQDRSQVAYQVSVVVPFVALGFVGQLP